MNLFTAWRDGAERAVHTMDKLVRTIQETNDRLIAVHSHVADIRERLRLAEPPRPFICILVEAELLSGQRTTLGTSGYMHGIARQFELVAHQSLKNVRVIVFADLERVQVRGVFCGVNFMQAAMGECPIAHFAEWLPGVKVTVDCLEVRA